MPAVNFTVTWPDGDVINYYSPSTIIHRYIESNTPYNLVEFKNKVDDGLNAASERVKESFGFYCSAANDEKQKIKEKYLQLIDTHKEGKVVITSFKQ